MTPQENPQLFGHQEVLKRLLDAHKQGKLHHGLIFTGPAGVGKETLAYHLMRMILKDRGRVASGNHPNILVIQPIYDEKKQKFKRDITLDSLAGMTNFLRLSPTDDALRFVLVNPADGMNNQTQNALLKVLEEPPQNTYFILLTTHVAAMLPTIRSRCLIVPVEPLNQKEFSAALQSFFPHADFDMLEHYQELGEGILGRVIAYDRDAVLGHYDRMCQSIFEWSDEKNSLMAMQFAESMAAPDMQDITDGLVDLFLQRLAIFIKRQAIQQATRFIADSEEQLFNRWRDQGAHKLLQDYERLQRLWQEGIAAYLDRKIVLLSFLRVVAGMDSVKEAVV